MINGSLIVTIPVGTGDQEIEKRLTQSIQDLFENIITDAMINGYNPKHSAQVKSIINKLPATIQIEEIGYFDDLVFYGLSDGLLIEDQADELSKYKQEFTKKIITRRHKLVTQRLTKNNEFQIIKSSMGEYFKKLTSETEIIIMTAVKQFFELGKRPQTDYAGIFMMVSKSFEREINHLIFKKWIKVARENFSLKEIEKIDQSFIRSKSNSFNYSLTQILLKKRRTDLGTIRFLLLNAGKSQSRTENKIEAHFIDFLKNFAGFEWLVSNEMGEQIKRIYTRYRNGGVHEHLVTHEICHEAIEAIVLGEDPLLLSLLKATSSNQS